MTTYRIKKCEDLSELKKILVEMVGNKCWKIHFRYGDELILQIGKRIHAPIPNIPKRFVGEWELSTRGSEWVLSDKTKTQKISSEEIDDSIIERMQIIKNSTIIDVSISFPKLDLSITFRNGYSLTVMTGLIIDKYNLSYWEIYIRISNMLLEVGPGMKWKFSEYKG